ncbi:MAG: SGNH/GDSL hydrolase family protein [Nonlabens sp.]
MKKTYIKFLGLFVAGALVISCENEFDESVVEGELYTSGEADFTNFVAVGNSLTAGFADGALYLQGQQNSYPNIMAQQMQLAGGGAFVQPLVNDNLGGLLLGGNQITQNRFVLASDGMGNPTGPSVLSGTPTTEVSNKVTGPLNNYGVPGARVFHLAASGYGSVAGVPAGTANPYYARFASSDNATVIGDAAAANPTFFTLWIGNNDILGYATSGGSGVDNNDTGETDPRLQGDNSITNNQLFQGVYTQLVATMTANGAEGALVNIPDVTSIPFFTTVPFAPLSPLDPAFGPQIPVLNQIYGGLNQIFAAFGQPDRQIQFSSTAASAVVVRDNDLPDLSANPAFINAFVPLVQGLAASQNPPLMLSNAQAQGLAQVIAPQFGQVRQANEDDLITFTAAGVIGTLDQDRFNQLTGVGLPAALAGQLSASGITFALGNQFVLTRTEQDRVERAQTFYNNVIQDLADANDLAFVDARSALQEVANGGVFFDGGLLSSTYASGGAFSLDGVHPTGRGYAYTANFLLQSINAQYGSTLPLVNIGQYPSVQPSDD